MVPCRFTYEKINLTPIMHSVTSSLPDEKYMHWTQILLILRVILPLKHLKDIKYFVATYLPI